MSRRLAMLLPAFAGLAVPAAAQTVYGPDTEAQEPSAEPPRREAKPCDETVSQEGAIIVCRELPESERYMSPVPKPVESDRRIIPGLNDPPCWVTNPGPGCIRVGWKPEPALIVDVTAFPEKLSEADAARVFAAEPAAEPETEDRIGERVPIDLGEGD